MRSVDVISQVAAAVLAAGLLPTSSAQATDSFPAFESVREYPLGEGSPARSNDLLTTGDVDGDGDLDVVMVVESGAWVLDNDGAANYDAVEPAFIPTGGRAMSADLGDVDLDGWADLVILWEDDEDSGLHIDVVINDRHGEFTPTDASTYSGGEGSSARDLTLTELDSDGYLDVVFGHDGLFSEGSTNTWGGFVTTLRNDGDGSFDGPPAEYFAGDLQASRYEVADLNDDGSPDLAAAGNFYDGEEPYAGVGWLLNDGTGTFRRDEWEYAGSDEGDFATGLAAGDIDNDQDQDLLITHVSYDDAGSPGDSEVSVFFNNGGNGDLISTPDSLPLPGALQLTPLGVGDLDGDGYLDVVSSGVRTGVMIAYYRGNESFRAPVSDGSPHPAGSIEVADLDGDGRNDIVTTETIYVQDTQEFLAGIRVRVQKGAGGGVECPAGNSAGVRCSMAGGTMRIIGTSGSDELVGTARGDVIVGGAGRDTIRARGGDDVMKVRDKTRDTVDGGAGRDTAIADRSDRLRKVEQVR